ncbi:MAG: hypothetical protein K2K89_12855 [Ruminococcus sp.]|nr:hypothetical protein [Ruminococcus sp.]
MGSERRYIDNLNINDIPWHRMITAYETAEHYPECLRTLDEMKDLDEVRRAWNDISDFEHQSTLFIPAPFVMVFLVRILEKAVNRPENPVAIWLADKLADEFVYYAEVCSDAEKVEHTEPLENMSDVLNDEYLLPENYTEDDFDEYYDEFFPDDLFYSIYYYTGKILLETLEIHDNCKLSVMKEKIKNFLAI